MTNDAAVPEGKDGVTLDCGEDGVAIGETALPFFISVPQGTYSTFKITVVSTDGQVQTRTASTDIVITRSKVTVFNLGFGELGPVSGSAPVLGGKEQPWVQLWTGGPKWARFNIGSTITSYANLTDYTAPDVVGGYYSFKGSKDSVPDSNGTEDTAYTLWGPNWATPTMEQEQDLADNCTWTFCDGGEVQYEPGCTLKGWKVSGNEPGFEDQSIFLPLGGVRDQNGRARQSVGGRGTFWSSSPGGYGAYFLETYANGYTVPSHDQPHGCSVRAICVGEASLDEGSFVIDPGHVKAIIRQFENYDGENPTLSFGDDYTGDLTITRSDGVIDLGGHSVSGTLYLQNNDPEKSVTVRNGTVGNIDGTSGPGSFAGKVELEDVNAGSVQGDGHPYSIKGGKFGVKPDKKLCAPGYYVGRNTGDDAETYPYMVIEGDPSDQWFNGPATDLSAEETANTYMVTTPGTYKIKATVKGNGGLDPLTGTTATPIDLADISGAAVLWELAAAGRALVFEDETYQVKYKDGYIWFNTPNPFMPGAAYIAVFKDSEGGTAGYYDKDVDEVLWSWMIWTTEEPEIWRFADTGVMDRNLGAFATGNAQYRGCAYEWGRKDPFPGCSNGSYTPSGYFPARMTAYSIVDFDAEGMTVAYSVAHPTTYPKGWSKRYWQTEDEFTTGMWWSGEKTIYDPSPAGWKVPSKDELNVARLSGVNVPGGGFLGNCRNDFEYGNPGSCYYWTSTGVDRDHAWAWYGGSTFSYTHVDNYLRSGYTIRQHLYDHRGRTVQLRRHRQGQRRPGSPHGQAGHPHTQGQHSGRQGTLGDLRAGPRHQVRRHRVRHTLCRRSRDPVHPGRIRPRSSLRGHLQLQRNNPVELADLDHSQAWGHRAQRRPVHGPQPRRHRTGQQDARIPLPVGQERRLLRRHRQLQPLHLRARSQHRLHHRAWHPERCIHHRQSDGAYRQRRPQLLDEPKGIQFPALAR